MRRTSTEWKSYLKEVCQRILELRRNAEYEKCLDCECYFGLLFYLNKELIIVDDVSSKRLFKKILPKAKKEEEAQMHACLGCDPCPPAKWTTEVIEKFES
jgi:hypothetical protein